MALVPGRARAALPSAQQLFRLEKDPEFNDRQFAIYLLQTAADIEHALMLQYLYAAYSLPSNLKVPGAKNPATGQDVTTRDWARTIAGIAREEMGHLLSVQLVLRALGGPISFEREHFPYRSQLYPFPLELEPLTKASLAKYVYAEMPDPIDPAVLTPEKQREILERAATSSGGVSLNHVGLLYSTLIEVVDRLPDSAFRPELADWQDVNPAEWIADEEDTVTGVKVLPIRIRSDGGPAATLKLVALRALCIIARQGEAITPTTAEGGMTGNGLTAAQIADSHFARFYEIYKQFPDDFFPALAVATCPNTTDAPDALPLDPVELLQEQDLSQGRITNPETLLWSHLFNVRYRILLAYLAHYIALPPRGKDAAETQTIKDVKVQLRTWIFDEMNGGDLGRRSESSIRGLAHQLAELDRDGAGSGLKAGATFEAPFTFALPELGPDRWRLHKDLYEASRDIVSKIPGHDTDSILSELTTYEEATTAPEGRIKFIDAHLNDPF